MGWPMLSKALHETGVPVVQTTCKSKGYRQGEVRVIEDIPNVS